MIMLLTCEVCGRKGELNQINGFRVHESCIDKVKNLDCAQFHSASVITHKDRTLDDRWYVIEAGTDLGHFTVKVYNSTVEYLNHQVAHVESRAFYVAAVAYAIAEFGKDY